MEASILSRLGWRSRLAIVVALFVLGAVGIGAFAASRLATADDGDDPATLAAIDAITASGATVRRLAAAEVTLPPVIATCIPASLLERFARFHTLTEVQLQGDQICDANLARLRDIRGLESLTLIGGCLSDAWTDFLREPNVAETIALVTVQCTADSNAGQAFVAENEREQAELAQVLKANGLLPAN